MATKTIFDLKHLKGDLFGGLTAGVVALPLALAFGVSSGLGPSAGLYGAIFVSFFAALFGGTNTQISGPTAPMTAVSMVVIASFIALNNGDVSKALPGILTVFLLSGLMQIGLGFLKLGTYIKYIPNPVVSGFMTAIGIIILITQILPSIGYYPKEDLDYVNKFKPYAEEVLLEKILSEEGQEGILVLEDFEETIARAAEITEHQILMESKTLAGKETGGVLGALNILPQAIQNISWLELCLTLITILIIYSFKKITTSIPSTLIALLAVSGAAYGLDLDYRTIEKIPSGLPMINFRIFSAFSLSTITPYIFTALTLAFLGSIDSLLTSVVADNMTKTKHRPNKELIGQGIGNTIAALFGGIPGAGATIRTVVNINAGGKTKLSGMLAGVLLLIILLLLGPAASQIPAAVLAGILVTVGIGVMDWKGLKAIPNLPKTDVFIMIVVLVLSSVWNLVYAVGIGLVLASLTFMKVISDLTLKRSTVATLASIKRLSDSINLPQHIKEDVVIKDINGPLFFGSTSDFQSMSKQIPPKASTIIIKMDEVTYMDQSGVFAMEDVVIELCKNDKIVLLLEVLEQPLYMMERINIIPDLITKNQIFKTEEDCLEWIKKNTKNTNK